MTSAASAGGIAGRRRPTGSGASVTWAASSALGGRPANGRLPGQQLVGEDTERVDVGAMIDGRVGGRLLGCHVRRRA